MADSAPSQTDWMRYISTMVITFKMPLEDAWNATVKEFWAMFDFHLEMTGRKRRMAGPTFQSAVDISDLEAHLKSIGAING